MDLDKTDKSILNLLQLNSKQTNKQLANHLNLSVTAIYERIKKLERLGIIKKYVAIIDQQKVDQNFMVFCHIKLAAHTRDTIASFEAEVLKFSEILECYHVSGEYDYLLKVVVKDMEHFRNFMVNKLTALSHIGSTQSSFTINELKNNTAINL